MAITLPEGRSRFQSSGRINWTRFLPWAALAWLGSVLGAAVLFQLFQWGWYLIFLAPLAAAASVGGLVLLAVRRGHCRSRLVAGTLGAIAGLTLYLGYFYFGMVSALGLENAGRIDLLPRYIEIRMRVTVIKDVGDTSQNQPEPGTGGEIMNWLIFAGEFGFVVFIAIAPGFRRASKPYCERCRDWMSRETTNFKPEVGPGFVEALRLNSVQSLAALFTSPPKNSPPLTAVALDYCPSLKTGASTDCPVYLSVKQVVQNPRGVTRYYFENSKGETLLRAVALEPPELAAVLPRFTVLEKATGTTAAQALEELHVESPVTRPVAIADIRPVDPLFAGRVLTTRAKLVGTLLMFLMVVGVFGPVGLAGLGAWLGFPDHPPEGGVSTTARFFGGVLIAVAAFVFLADMVMLFTAPDFFRYRYLLRRIRREFSRRPNHLVSPGDPEAHFVEIVPRANWGSLKLEVASDLGFLRVDSSRREVLFEGDNEYYRIPPAAITSCEVERFVTGQGTHAATVLYRVVLQINTPAGSVEKPISRRGTRGMFMSKKRERWARELARRINGMIIPQAA
jgi:hypothetical protein